VLLQERHRIEQLVAQLKRGDATPAVVAECEAYVRKTLGHEPAAGQTLDAHKLLKLLERPLRVCGMVPNTGEPGGGPFWVRDSDGSLSLQVVESAQMNLADAGQSAVFKAATHFNPVDLVCSAKSFDHAAATHHHQHKGHHEAQHGAHPAFYSLLAHRDLTAGFITSKSQEGRELKAQELPGLWNGAMADWNTVFVEVPIETFNPVKTVSDLLRKEHQQQQ